MGRLVIVSVVGLGVAALIAKVAGLPGHDAVVLVAISFGGGLAVLRGGRPAHQRPRPPTDGQARHRAPSVVALIPVVSLALGAMVAARSMFVSTHDLQALAVVIAGAGTAGVLGALLLADELEAHAPTAGREPATPGSHRPIPSGAGGVGEPRPAHAAGRHPGHGRGADRRRGRRPGDGRLATTRTSRVEAERLARLVDDLFELSRLQVDGVQLSVEPVSLGDLVSDAIASAAPVARAKGVHARGPARRTRARSSS